MINFDVFNRLQSCLNFANFVSKSSMILISQLYHLYYLVKLFHFLCLCFYSQNLEYHFFLLPKIFIEYFSFLFFELYLLK